MDAPPSPKLDSSSVVCLWASGFLADRAALLRQTSLAADASDRRLLEALYQRWGDQLPARLCGSKAFALWDGKRRRLLMVRDRMGLSGLYFRVSGQRLEVSDRVETLLRRPLDADRLDPVSVIAHLQGCSPPPGRTFHSDIQALPPGVVTVATSDSMNGRSYWAPRLGTSLNLNSDAQYAEALRDLLTETVSRYAPEQRVGVALSGGLDSTATAAALRMTSPSQRLHAFTCVSPEEPAADESELARAVCRRLSLPLTEVRSEDCFPMRDGISVGPDSPYCFYYSEIWNALFAKARRAGFSVMLSGGGGDHLFGGGLSPIPDLLLTGRWGRAYRGLVETKRRSGFNLWQLVRRTVLGPFFRAYPPWWKNRSHPPRPWLTPRSLALWRETNLGRESVRLALPGRIHRLRLFDVSRISQVCESLNRTAAGHQIELRHPLFDHRLVEFALSLPSDQTFRNGVDKFVLRNSMVEFLPEEVGARTRKTAPGAILHRSVSERRRDYVGALTRRMRAAELGFVEEAPLREGIHDYVEGKHRDAGFWQALTLEAWLRRHF